MQLSSYRHLKHNNVKHLLKATKSYIVFFIVTVGSISWLASCSTEKTGWAHRTYHNTTAHYNGYFNAKELVRLKVKELNNEPEDFSDMLPIFKYPTEENLQNVIGDMDKAIEKCKRVISKHSIEKRGDQYVKWIDDTYLLMGRAHFYKQELPQAKEMFNYVSKKFKEEEIRYDALLWLGKTYVEDKNYQKAERILRLAEGEANFPDRLKREMYLTYADMFIKQGNYLLAITDIQRAIDLTDKRKEQARLYFILAQVYQELGERGEASFNFAKVVALNPSYDMIFYARIQRALSFSQDYGGKSEIRKELLEMLKDDKNIEFRDQIYYALAELEMADENEEEAIDYYNLSTRTSVSNDPQKGLSFLKLGDIYFEKPEYTFAQMYYDSAVTFMDNEHERYEDILKLSRNLNDLIEQLSTIERQDSLQKVASMSEEARLALIDDLIYQRKMEEEERRQRLENEKAFNENQANNSTGGNPGLPGSGNSNGDWYFYNPTAVGFGASEFKKIWGSRKNEDNWRRSNKSQEAPTNTPADEGGDDFFVNADGDTVQATNDWQDPNYYLKDLPLTDEAMELSDSLIVEAYNNLGLIYKEKLQDEPKAIEAFEALNKRYEMHHYLLTIYYRLYRMHSDLKHYTEADYYKNKILNDYPDSDYAKIIRDPESLQKDNEEEKEAKEFYTNVYENYFKRGFYSQTITSAEKGIQLFEGTSVEPKLRFIRAMSVGQDGGESAMREELEALAFKYKGKPIGKKAEEMLAALDELEKLEEQRRLEASKPKEEAAEANSPYSFEPSSNHNYIVLIPIQKVSSNNAQIAISNFNRSNFKSKDLNVSTVLLSSDTAMITIKSFKSAAEIKSYARAFKNDKLKLVQIHAANSPHFSISFNNYAIFYQRKSLAEYLSFYENNYAL